MRQRWWVAALRWPLWSWPRLAATAVAVLAVAWGAGQVQTALAGAPVSAGTPASSAPSDPFAPFSASPGGGFGTLPGSADGGVPTTGPLPATTAPPAPATALATPTGAASTGRTAGTPHESAAVAARRFVIAWAKPDLPAAQWFAGLSALCTPRLSALLASTDPGRVPASRVLDPAPTATADPVAPAVGSTVQVAVSTDAGRIRVRLVATRTGWLADAVEPDAQPPAGSPSAGG